MSLSRKQQDFTKCIGELICYAYRQGYALSFGDAYRDPRLHGEFGEKKSYSATNSVHKVRLAVDLNLFVEGEYITDGDHPAYIDLGEFWERLHDSARWGGRFNDANHYSFEHWGCK